MRRLLTLLACVGMLLPSATLLAQVPHVLTYQGRVTSGGTNFSGTGQFKFALVSGGTTAATPASGSATVYFGFVVQIAVTSGGAGYTTAPAVTITDSSGSGATAVAHVANGQVNSITVTDAGSGYSANPTITIAPPPANLSYTTFWSHDGSSSAGGEPASAVAVAVTQGLFTVGLGDTLVPNMTALPSQTLANPDVRLRIWFNDGVHGFSQLSPDQRLTSAAYAMMADTVRDGAITAAKLAPGSITSAQIAPGSITANQLADGAVTSAKLAANIGANFSVPAGTIVLSPDPSSSNLIAAGFARISGYVKPNEWELHVADPIPGFRFDPEQSAVWTGTDVILWGGSERGGPLAAGVKYRPTTAAWSSVSSLGPSARFRQSAVWTGTEMIIWGGRTPAGSLGDGARYSPSTDIWRQVSTVGAPSARSYHTAVWTGSEMIVWGGYEGQGTPLLNSGTKYSPSEDRWTSISPLAPAPRAGHVAVWTGTEMLVWGGWDAGGLSAQGGRYNPATDNWRSMTTNNAPPPGNLYSAYWTGSEMIVWSGWYGGEGGSYNPARDEWRKIRSMPKWESYEQALTAWTGTHLVVISPRNESSRIGLRGAIYDLAKDEWSGIQASDGGMIIEPNSPAVWIGLGVFVASTEENSSAFNALHYSPLPPLYQYLKQ